METLLESHYDPAYYRSQRKHAEKYNPPTLAVTLASPSETHLDEVISFFFFFFFLFG